MVQPIQNGGAGFLAAGADLGNVDAAASDVYQAMDDAQSPGDGISNLIIREGARNSMEKILQDNASTKAELQSTGPSLGDYITKAWDSIGDKLHLW